MIERTLKIVDRTRDKSDGLSASKLSDATESEADAIADRVMQMSVSKASTGRTLHLHNLSII